MYLSHRSEPIRQRCREAGDIGQPFHHPIEFEATIEPIGKFGQVAPEMFSVNRMVGAVNCILDISKHRIDPAEFPSLHTGGSTTGDNAPVRASLHDRPETGQAIGDHLGIRRQMLARPSVNRVAAKALQRRQAHRQRATVGAAGHGGDKRGLAARPAAALAAPMLAAPVGIVNLDQARQRFAVIALPHGLHQLVLDQPGGLVRHPEVAAQRQRRQPRLALGEQENRQKPGRQRQFGLFKQGSGGQRRLVVAAMTLKQSPSLQLAVRGIPTVRTAKALRPAQLEQRFPASRFGAIFFEEFGQTETFLKLNRIPAYFVTSCLSGGSEISNRPSQ